MFSGLLLTMSDVKTLFTLRSECKLILIDMENLLNAKSRDHFVVRDLTQLAIVHVKNLTEKTPKDVVSLKKTLLFSLSLFYFLFSF